MEANDLIIKLSFFHFLKDILKLCVFLRVHERKQINLEIGAQSFPNALIALGTIYEYYSSDIDSHFLLHEIKI